MRLSEEVQYKHLPCLMFEGTCCQVDGLRVSCSTRCSVDIICRDLIGVRRFSCYVDFVIVPQLDQLMSSLGFHVPSATVFSGCHSVALAKVLLFGKAALFFAKEVRSVSVA